MQNNSASQGNRRGNALARRNNHAKRCIGTGLAPDRIDGHVACATMQKPDDPVQMIRPVYDGDPALLADHLKAEMDPVLEISRAFLMRLGPALLQICLVLCW